jgi:hypothetical protein
MLNSVWYGQVGLPQLPASSERAMGALEHRLSAGKNARNALMLLKRITCHPLVPGRAITLAAACQAVLHMLMAGPLRTIRIETEDLPPAAVREAEVFARRFLGSEQAQHMKVCSSRAEVAGKLLEAAKTDAQLARGVCGWCLKFLFEGEAMEDEGRRQQAFVQSAREAVAGPLAGVCVWEAEDGLVWSWDDGKVEGDGALQDLAAAYGQDFELVAGCSLGFQLACFSCSVAFARPRL